MTDTPLRICILGGGFGGLYTAKRLSELPWESSQQPEIVLIDKGDRFLFSPLLYELVTGEMQTWEIAPPFTEILADTGISFLQALVTGIDVENGKIQLDDRPELAYDKLVIALGGSTPLNLVKGALEYTIPFRTLQDAYRLSERLQALERSKPDNIRVAVVGGGYSGVELVCKLADRLEDRAKLRLVERGDKILPAAPEFNRTAAQQALESRKVWLDLETEVEKIDLDSISLSYKGQVDTIPVDLVLWAVGTQVPELMEDLPFKRNNRGLLTTKPTLQLADRDNIFALGDIADCQDASGQQVPPTAQAAFQQADYCAWNIWASATGRPLLPFRYQALGEMLALGIDNAAMEGLGMKLDGTLAYVARRLIYLYRLPSFQHQLKVGLNWISAPIVDLFN